MVYLGDSGKILLTTGFIYLLVGLKLIVVLVLFSFVLLLCKDFQYFSFVLVCSV